MASLSDDDEDEDAGAAAQALIAKKNAEREAAKRAAKGGPPAKSSLILDIKPEDSETDMNELLGEVKQIEMEGLTWGGHEFIPVAFGIKKLRIIVRTAALSTTRLVDSEAAADTQTPVSSPLLSPQLLSLCVCVCLVPPCSVWWWTTW